MKLGDNGEAFFVEETEEEYVSLVGYIHFADCIQASRTCPKTEIMFSSFHGYRDDCCRLNKF